MLQYFMNFNRKDTLIAVVLSTVLVVTIIVGVNMGQYHTSDAMIVPISHKTASIDANKNNAVTLLTANKTRASIQGDAIIILPGNLAKLDIKKDEKVVLAWLRMVSDHCRKKNIKLILVVPDDKASEISKNQTGLWWLHSIKTEIYLAHTPEQAKEDSIWIVKKSALDRKVKVSKADVLAKKINMLF